MCRIRSYVACHSETKAALEALASQIAEGPVRNGLLVSFYGAGHDEALIAAFIAEHFPDLPTIGGTSSGGIMTERGFADAGAIGLLVIEDEAGEFGAASGAFDGDAEEVARRVLEEALDACDCTGQLPEVIWIYQTPGHEEAVIRGLRSVVGDTCVVMGGTAADADGSGRWRVLGGSGALENGLTIAVMFPSVPVGFAFQGGYEPAGPTGTITGVGFWESGQSGVVTEGGGRNILTIDGVPAAEIYNRWSGNAIEAKLGNGGSILAETTMFPLAIDVGEVDGVSQYLLIHPESVLPMGGLRTFREVEIGMRVHAMRGDRQQLVARAGRVASHARRKLAAGGEGIAGAIVVYCGGCKLAVGDEIIAVAETVDDSLGGAPFIGCFTFGEQGMLRERNVHGNLMISALVFGS